MKTLNTKQAASLLQIHPVTLTCKAKGGEIPGRKIAGKWLFIEEDLQAYIRSGYAQPKPRPVLSYPVELDQSQAVSKQAYYRALGLSDCPQIHSPQPAARSGARHARAARQVAKGEAVELVGKSELMAESSARTMQGA